MSAMHSHRQDGPIAHSGERWREIPEAARAERAGSTNATVVECLGTSLQKRTTQVRILSVAPRKDPVQLDGVFPFCHILKKCGCGSNRYIVALCSSSVPVSQTSTSPVLKTRLTPSTMTVKNKHSSVE